MLPVGPIDASGCPYNAPSAFAAGEHLIDLNALKTDGLLRRDDLNRTHYIAPDRARYAAALAFRRARLVSAFSRFQATGGLIDRAYKRFCRAQSHWLDDYALYAVLRHDLAVPWWHWPRSLRDRDAATLDLARQRLHAQIEYHRFTQFVFDRQWRDLRHAAFDHGVGLIGDLPIFVAHDSADVWAHPRLFQLTPTGWPTAVSGVGPDMFSRDGQRWGNPLYDWPKHHRTGYAWWVQRFTRLAELFDAIRIDHFIGFHRYYAIPARAKTARNGRWRKGPGARFFAALLKQLPKLQLIAEDLGHVTPGVHQLRDRFNIAPTRVLAFAFDHDRSPHAPDRLPPRCAAYTTNHDLPTAQQLIDSLPPDSAAHARAIKLLDTSPDNFCRDTVRALYRSAANTAIVHLPDALGLGAEARFNTPGTCSKANWTWRLQPDQLKPAVARRLAALAVETGRAR